MRLHKTGIIVALMLALFSCAQAESKTYRSRAQVDRFLRQHGFERTPPGYQVDHIIPLCAGGEDAPENMQLLTVEEHRRKTKVDLWLCRWLRRMEGEKGE